MELLGTHGTSRTRAESIQLGQFKRPHKAGRAGTGVYFWSYEDEIDLALELAKLWWKRCFDNGDYVADTHKDCKVVCASLNLDQSLFFDASDSYFQTKLFQTAKSRNVTNQYGLARLYDVVISDIEKALNVKYLVIVANVSRPNSTVSTPMISCTPSFKCYVVRDKLDEVIVINTIV